MSIAERTEQLRIAAQSYGRYQYVSEKSGVSFHWLQKFACGEIPNPTVENVSKIEAFFITTDSLTSS